MAEYHNEQLTVPEALIRDAMVCNQSTRVYLQPMDVHRAIDRLSGAMLNLLIEVDMISRRLDLLEKKHKELDKTVKNMDEAVHRLEFPQL